MEEQLNEDVYGGFAYSYDLFMDDIPYDAWADYLHSLFIGQGISSGLMLELGCGTGNMTVRMAARGYDMIGLDISEDMLEVARQKIAEQKIAEQKIAEQKIAEQKIAEQKIAEQKIAEQKIAGQEAGVQDILFLNQDMRDMELYGTVAGAYCVCDGMNYLLEPQDLQRVFTKVNNYLEAGGIFVFDMKTSYFYEKILGNRMIAENREDASLLWENEYHRETAVNEYYLTVYQLEDEEAGLFSRTDEHHFQRAYEIDTVRGLIEAAGMETVAVYDAFTKELPGAQSERIYFIAREQYQEGKYYG